MPGSERSFTNVELKIPITCPSLADTCGIIKNEYSLRLKIGPSSEEVIIPITIGTVPVVDENANSWGSPLPQPRYVKSMTTKAKKDENGVMRTINVLSAYSPMYPVFS